jgi:hypothetical protein
LACGIEKAGFANVMNQSLMTVGVDGIKSYIAKLDHIEKLTTKDYDEYDSRLSGLRQRSGLSDKYYPTYAGGDPGTFEGKSNSISG